MIARTRGGVVLVLAVVAMGLLAGSAPALARPEVVVGGRGVMRFGSDAKMSADRKAAAVQKKLDALLRRRLPASGIAVDTKGGMCILSWAGHVFCTVDANQAKENGCSPRDLAARWAHNLKEAVEAGFLCVNPGSLAVPVGETRKVAIEGVARGRVHLAVDSKGVQARLASEGTISVRGMVPGHFRLTVQRDGARVTVPVVVSSRATRVPRRIERSSRMMKPLT